MIPIFFKALKPAAPVNPPDDDQMDSDIVPDEGEGNEDAAAPADAQNGPDDAENAGPDAQNPAADAEKPAADAPPEAVDPADPDADAAAAADPDSPEAEPADAPMSNFTELLAIVAERTSSAGSFGPDVVKPGHHVAFAAGDFAGSGKVAASGRDGVKVHDSSGREHSVHWREVTGHFAGDDEEGDDAPAEKPAKAAAK